MLIQVLITLGLMAVLTMLNASSMKSMADQQEVVSRKLAAQGIFNSVMSNMTSGAFCTCNFAGVSVNEGATSVTLPKGLRIFYSGQCDPAMSSLIGDPGKDLTPPQYGLKLKSVLLDNLKKLDTDSYSASLSIEINANSGLAMRPLAIPGILVKIDPSTKKILSCNTYSSAAATICPSINPSEDGFDICTKGAHIRITNESNRNILSSLIATADPDIFLVEGHAPGGRWAKFLLDIKDADKNIVLLREVKTDDHAFKIRMCHNHLMAASPSAKVIAANPNPPGQSGFCYSSNFNGNPDPTANCSSDINITVRNKGTTRTTSTGSCYSKMPLIVGPKCGSSPRISNTNCPIVL